MKARRIEILGVPVDCVNMRTAVKSIDSMMGESGPNAIIAINPEKVMRSKEDERLLSQIKVSSLLIPDGIGVVFAARILGLGRMERVPGSELMPALCDLAARRGYKIFLFGASPEVNQCAAQRIQETYPGIKIVGRRDGYLKEQDIPGLISQINSSGADILFVALGSPRQEYWMLNYLSQLNVKVCQGVGGTFDVICGNVRRAPVLMRKFHMEWLHRLFLQPKRFFRQTNLLKFTYLVVREKIKRLENRHNHRSS